MGELERNQTDHSEVQRKKVGKNQISINNQMVDEKQVDLLMLRERLPTIYHQYQFITENLGLYLPPWKVISKRPKWATENYLFGVMTEKYFSIPRAQLKKPKKVYKKLTKAELSTILEKLCGKDLGFKIDYEPEKKWYHNLIYSLDPNHELFRPVDQIIKATIPSKYLFSLLYVNFIGYGMN